MKQIPTTTHERPRASRIALTAVAWLGAAFCASADPVRLVKEILPIGDNSNPPYRMSRFVALGDRLVFAAQDDSTLPWLWATDGTTEGTVRLLSSSANIGGTILGPTVLGRVALFGIQGREIWKTDGTVEGTVLVKRVPIASAQAGCSYLDVAGWPCRAFVVVGNLAYFITDRFELWRTDGTPAGTIPVMRNGNSAYPIAFQGRLFFQSMTPQGLFGLFSSDGSARGTRLVKRGPFFLTQPVVGAGKLFFVFAEDWRHREVWVSDGTPRGTRRLTHLTDGNPDLSIAELASSGRAVFFKVVTGTGQELWTSDGTPAGTHAILQGNVFLEGGASAALGGRLYFFASIEGELRLWESDASIAGTHEVKNLRSVDYVGSPYGPFLEVAAGRIYFAMTSGLYFDLWVSDGTDFGTRPIAAFEIDSVPGGMARLGSSVLFGAHDGRPTLTHGELWAIAAPVDVSVRDTRVAGDPCGATAAFRVVLSGPSEEPITVDFATADGSARAGVDYEPTSGTLTVPPGEVTGLVQVPLTCRSPTRGGRATFFLDFTNAKGARITRSRATAGLGSGQVRGD